MYKRVAVVTAGVLGLALGSVAFAQDESVKPVEEPLDLTEPGHQDAMTGLKVEARRYENRLDGVTVERKGGKVQDYYDLADPDIERREGGIIEGGAMRTWRFGGGR